jgi:hypothetical protein
MTVEVEARLMVDDGMGDTRQLSVDDYKSISTVRLDSASATVTYVGEAAAGSAEGDAVWRIKKIDESVGLSIKWADGNTNFDNIWTNRASLTYT